MLPGAADSPPARQSAPGSLSNFFFQAEDGIRDDLVTGVQTCALPISPTRAKRPGPACRTADGAARAERGRALSDPGRRSAHAAVRPASAQHGAPDPPDLARRGGRARRSEERRVGKECRTGGSEEN